MAGGNGFYINGNKNYYEFFVGLDNIFKQIRIDFVQSYLDGKAWQHADEIERTNQARNQTRDGQRHSFGSGQFSGDFSEFF